MPIGLIMKCRSVTSKIKNHQSREILITTVQRAGHPQAIRTHRHIQVDLRGADVLVAFGPFLQTRLAFQHFSFQLFSFSAFTLLAASRPAASSWRNRKFSNHSRFRKIFLSGPEQNRTATVQNRIPRRNKTGFVLFDAAIVWWRTA
jgi:hypothetical protein